MFCTFTPHKRFFGLVIPSRQAASAVEGHSERSHASESFLNLSFILKRFSNKMISPKDFRKATDVSHPTGSRGWRGPAR